MQPALVGRAERTTYSASGYEGASSLEHSFRQRPSDAGTILPSNHRLCSHAQPLAPFVVLSSTTTVHHTLHPFSSIPNHPLLFCPLVQEKRLFKFPSGLHEREARHGLIDCLCWRCSSSGCALLLTNSSAGTTKSWSSQGVRRKSISSPAACQVIQCAQGQVSITFNIIPPMRIPNPNMTESRKYSLHAHACSQNFWSCLV